MPEETEEQRAGAAVEAIAQGLQQRWAAGTHRDKPWSELSSDAREVWRRMASYAIHEVPRFTADPQTATGMVISTLYSATAYKPLVQIDLGKTLNFLQIDAREVRDFALSLIEAAEASMSDAFLIEFFKRFDFQDEQLWGVIREFREWRGARVAKPPEDPQGAVLEP